MPPCGCIMTTVSRRGQRRSADARVSAVPALAGRVPPSPLPEAAGLMLCTLVAEPFDHPAWLFEPKYDGLRVLGRFDGHDLTLLSRNDQPQNLLFPEIATALRASLTRPAL